MKKFLGVLIAVCSVVFLLAGAIPAGNKNTSMVVIYAVTASLALLLLAGHFVLIEKNQKWFTLMFGSVAVVNVGYYMLAVSGTLSQALMANRISYLGAAFLPVWMFMIILSVTKLEYPRRLPAILITVAAVIFAIAASPGILDVYYKEVYFTKVGSVTVLDKVYGPLHQIYLFYLVLSFGAMIAMTLQAYFKNKLPSLTYAVVILMAVFVNISVWMLEQLVKIDFEFLSISYIISELFLIGVHLMVQEQEKHKTAVEMVVVQTDVETTSEEITDNTINELKQHFENCIAELTPTEKKIFDYYISGVSTKGIMEQLNIKENTLKFHNKNIYSKFGISSRKQLLQMWKESNEQ